jgi:hypothetical protein
MIKLYVRCVERWKNNGPVGVVDLVFFIILNLAPFQTAEKNK